MKNEDFTDSVVPQDVLEKFFEFLNKNNTTTKRYFDVDEVTNAKVQVREVTETRQNDLKSTLALFQTIYPQHFDKLTQERILKAQQETGKTELEDIVDALKKGFQYEGE